MSTTYDTTGLPQTFAPIKPVGFFERFRVAFREWRERRRVLLQCMSPEVALCEIPTYPENVR